jgi:hypothetical protein
MASGFFYTVGYISTKIDNIGNKGFINSLVEGFNHAKKEFDRSKETKIIKKTVKKTFKKNKKKLFKKKLVKKNLVKKKLVKKKHSVKK